MIKGTKIRLSHLTAAEKLEERSLKQLEEITENGRHFSEKATGGTVWRDWSQRSQ